MIGLLLDVNLEGHWENLVRLLQDDVRRGHWILAACRVWNFADMGLERETLDSDIWQRCQDDGLFLLTLNRNEHGPDSLGKTIRQRNTSDSFPVLTISDADRMLHDPAYAVRVADRLLDVLNKPSYFMGWGRMYLP